MEALIDELLSDALGRESIEIVNGFALPLQSRALTYLLNVPESEAEIWIGWGIHVFNVTGVFIRNADPQNAADRMATLSASMSLDGKEWTEVWKTNKTAATWEFPVTSFVSGAMRPGREVRYLRLQTHPAKPAPLLLKQVEILGK